MNEVEAHYADLLADHYSWMFGDFDTMVARQKALLETLGIGPGTGATAIDLGAGSGFQTLALSELGYKVIAIDTSDKLLAELAGRARGLDIECRCQTLLALDQALLRNARVVVCMGDTLPHLQSKSEVGGLFETLATELPAGAAVVLTFRDLTEDRVGTQRFIPVRSDETRIMTCFLEYEPETVVVHDLIYEHTGDGWRFHASAYRKLRLGAGEIVAMLEGAGFSVPHHSDENGFVVIKAVR